ncbi:tail tube GTA-gp10-like protein [Hoeflea halophila]|uniref:Tail tube GTA-gp10-like protein n=1 Tax=Hoeflea halophila TaxID=714899 RepID=A0A286IBS4_9HYPH|nr:gene transfer agent family protein [Hoeflea halophila]SOE17467.1 tail tube GTA-gp10-like protein [Hoeflea halophila]
MKIYPNRHRGEIAAKFDGETRLMCLTLGALAELESAFDVANLGELAGRFEAGQLSAGDIIRIVGAGLRGAGNRLSDDDVAEMSTEDGAAGFARIATELLWVSFGSAEAAGHAPQISDREGRAPDRPGNPPGPQVAGR